MWKRAATASILLACAAPAWAQTADEVIARCVTALGGRAALAKVRSRSTAGTITLSTPSGDITGSVETLDAAPNKSRLLIKADLTPLGAGPLVLDQRFDGNAGYVMDTLQGNRDITGNQLQNMRNRSFPIPFLNYKEKGTSARLSGSEPVGDRDAYVIVFEPTSGSVVREYIDAATYLPIRSVISVEVPQLGREVELRTDYLDYRDVDGIKIPFHVRATSAIQSYSITVTRVEHNVKVDETLFSKPRTP